MTQKPDYLLVVSRIDIFLFILSFVCLFLDIKFRSTFGELIFYLAVLSSVIIFFVSIFLGYLNTFGAVRARKIMLSVLNPHITGEEKILDVGTGSGFLLVALAKMLTGGGKVVGVDMWETDRDPTNSFFEKTLKTPKLVRSNAQIEGVAHRVEILGGDPRNLPCKTEDFDVVVSMGLFHHLTKGSLDRTLIQMTRVLKNGGYLLIHDFLYRGYEKTLLRRFGMEIIREVPTTPLFPLSSCLLVRKPPGGIVLPEDVAATVAIKVDTSVQLASLTKEQEEELKKLKK